MIIPFIGNSRKGKIIVTVDHWFSGGEDRDGLQRDIREFGG